MASGMSAPVAQGKTARPMHARASTITADLRATLQNLERGTDKFDENMKALQSSWPFKKYFRKKAKAQKNK